MHQGIRPPSSALPHDVSDNIIDMIKITWDKNRTKRKTAAECVVILENELLNMNN